MLYFNDSLRLKSFASSTRGARATLTIVLETEDFSELGWALISLAEHEAKQKAAQKAAATAAKKAVGRKAGHAARPLALPAPQLALPAPQGALPKPGGRNEPL